MDKITPQKSLGQNFLVNQNFAEKIVSLSGIGKEDLVLEIGPGKGMLTAALCAKSGEVVAIEKSAACHGYLLRHLDADNIRLINGDIMKLDLNKLQLSDYGYRLVANLPYNIASRLIIEMITRSPRPQAMTVMMQREVAEKMIAKEGDLSLFSVLIQSFSLPKMLMPKISPGNFRPRPKVFSSLIGLSGIQEKNEFFEKKIGDKKLFFNLVKAGFARKRKLLAGNISQYFKNGRQEALSCLKKLNISPQARAQEISVDKWMEIAFYLLRL